MASRGCRWTNLSVIRAGQRALGPPDKAEVSGSSPLRPTQGIAARLGGILVLATERASIRWTHRVPQLLVPCSLVLAAAASRSMSAARRSDAHRDHDSEHLQAEANRGSGVSGYCRRADPWVIVDGNLDDCVPCYQSEHQHLEAECGAVNAGVAQQARDQFLGDDPERTADITEVGGVEQHLDGLGDRPVAPLQEPAHVGPVPDEV